MTSSEPPVVDPELYQEYLQWVIENGTEDGIYNYPMWLVSHRLDLRDILEQEPREADLTQLLIDVVDKELEKCNMKGGE